MVKIVCISDTHGTKAQNVISIPECDILIHSGDISQTGTIDQVINFTEWFLSLEQCKHKVFIAGNHDFLFEDANRTKMLLSNYKNITYLNQELKVIEGLNIYGEPRQPWFYDWAFNIERPNMKEVWKKVPRCTDVLVTHGPPHGYGDINRNKEHIGCGWQRKLLEEGFLKLIVCGHIHTGYGMYKHDNTHIINASICNDKRVPTNNPIIINVDP